MTFPGDNNVVAKSMKVIERRLEGMCLQSIAMAMPHSFSRRYMYEPVPAPVLTVVDVMTKNCNSVPSVMVWRCGMR